MSFSLSVIPTKNELFDWPKDLKHLLFLLILTIFHGYYVYYMLLPLFMAFLVSRESHAFIIKSPIYRSMSDCKLESLSWLCCLHIVCLYCITGIRRQRCSVPKYSLRLVVYTFQIILILRKIVLICTTISLYNMTLYIICVINFC